MNNWEKYTLAAVVVLAAGFAYINGTHRDIPADLRDAVSDSSFEALKTEAGEEASGFSVSEPEIKPLYVETGSRKAPGNKDANSIQVPRGEMGTDSAAVTGDWIPSARFYRNQIVAALSAERILAANGADALARFSKDGDEIMLNGEEKYKKTERAASGLLSIIRRDIAGTGAIFGGSIPKRFGEVNEEFLGYVSRVTPISFSASPRCVDISPEDYERGILELRREYQHAGEIGKKGMLRKISSMELKAFEQIAAGQ